MAAEKDIRATRRHRIVEQRASQLTRNQLVYAGGAPYIDERLTRFPHESQTAWDGNAQLGILGRKERAYLINYATRIVTKINQLVFGQEIGRENIDQDFAADATRTGMTIAETMDRVSAYLTAAQWCWIGIDRAAPPVDPSTGQRTARSLAAREAAGDRIWWSIWKPTEVCDWCFGPDGKLLWLITQEDTYDNSDVNAEAKTGKLRTVWQRGGGFRLLLNKDDASKVDSVQEFTISANIVPFVPAGIPTDAPWWFDDVERVQASLLNLESAHHENLITAVYPQMVIPAGTIDTIMRQMNVTGLEGFTSAMELIRGLNYPMLEATEAAGLTRYLTPSALDLKALPDEILRRRKELYDIVGLALQNESRQIASAEAKAWDHLDPEAVLQHRSSTVEAIERKAVEVSRQLDTSFPAYAPQYPRKFDVRNVSEDFASLLELDRLSMPFEVSKQLMRTAVEMLDKMSGIPADRKKAMLAEIDAMQEPTLDVGMNGRGNAGN